MCVYYAICSQNGALVSQVTYGFDGCISELRLGGAALPLEAGGTSGDGRVQLARRMRVRVGAACPALAAPTPCASYPCLNGGTCRELPALLEGEGEGFVCACHARFLGGRCERDVEPCASQPCLHGGACAPDGGGGYRCACPAPLQGARCERGRFCEEDACAHGGACEEGDSAASCRCRGYYGPRCELDVDECAGEPCLNGATCLNEPGSFRCLCPPDKTGQCLRAVRRTHSSHTPFNLLHMSMFMVQPTAIGREPQSEGPPRLSCMCYEFE